MPTETFIHPMAVVESGARIGEGVRIGPFCHVGSDATLGDRVELIGSVTVMGATTIGAGTIVYPQAVLGAPPQNAKHKGGRTTLTIGQSCVIREAVTMHCGTDTSRGETTVGDHGTFMAYTHIAHDCIVGPHATFANGATLGGHCEIGAFVTIGGLTAVLQFVRIGDRAFLAGCSAVLGDVIPYGIVAGNRARLRGLNIIGLKRSGMSRPDIHALRHAYRMIFDRDHPLAENLQGVKAAFADRAVVQALIAFMDGRDKRQFTLPPVGRLSDDGADDED